MKDMTVDILRGRLIERRGRLHALNGGSQLPGRVEDLLRKVDAALDRMEEGTYGVCENCHDEVEEERLMVEPLLRFCLDCLTWQQQRELEQDLELASLIQVSLLPQQQVTRGGWMIAHHYQPAGMVSGDYCDLISSPGSEDGTFFIIGDVSGKGIAASMLMSQLHAIFRSLAGFEPGLAGLVERANRLFCEFTQSMHYSTLVCGSLGESGQLQLCNAGHLPALLLQRGECSPVHATGYPLGLFYQSKYETVDFNLKRGESVVLYTDGLNETLCRDREYGLERVQELADRNADLEPGELIGKYLEDLAEFSGGAPRTDDLTIMVIRRRD